MQIFAELRRTHTDLLKKLDSYRNSEEKQLLIEPVYDFLRAIGQSSNKIQDDDERSYLLSIITFWSSFIYENTQKYPNINLRPFEEISENFARASKDDNYSNILLKLRQKLNDAELSGDLVAANSIAKDITLLEKWLADGLRGNCPVDLSVYGLDAAISGSSSAETREVQENIDIETVAKEEADHFQRNLRLELEKVRQYMEREEWHEAVALAMQVEGLAQGAVKETVRDILAQAQIQLNRKLEEALSEGDAARMNNRAQEARQHYKAALDLDPFNSHARFALQELDGLVQEKISKEQQDSLRAGLNERRDIRRLGEAIYEAEALDGEDKLPAKLVALLKEAREYYDNTRRRMGEETTAMRFGDVQARADAVAKIEARVATGTRTIYDATTETDKPAFELLREAQALLQQASEDTAQYEINFAEKFKALRPNYVHQRLRKALQYPLYEQEKRKLEEKLAEVDQYIQAQEKAENLQAEAMQEADPIRRLGILLQANQTFSELVGLQEQIAQARPIAISVLHVKANDALQRAELLIGNQEYSGARSAINDAEAQIARWPEQQRPEEITSFLYEAKALRQRIDEIENTWKEYTLLARDIRQKVADQNQRAAGLRLFEQVREEERFKGFSDLRVLMSEIDPYKDVGEQLNDATSARDRSDWHRVFEITDKVLKGGTAGKLSPHFQDLYADAVAELNIQRAQEFLASDEILEANNILSATLNKERERGPERESILHSRLANELTRVQQAIRNNKPMQTLYDRACDLLSLRNSITFKVYTSPSFALRQSQEGADGEVSNPEIRALINRLKDSSEKMDPTPAALTERVANILLAELTHKGVSERLLALRLFRYVSGDQTQSTEDDWPPYNLSLRTAEAYRAARLLSDSLRMDVLEPLVQKYKEYEGKEGELTDETLRMMAEQAARLREAYLLKTEDERGVGRWAEVEWGKRLARKAEKKADWYSAVEIWKLLSTHYPGVRVVKESLRNARIQYTIDRAHYLLYSDHKFQDALNLLKGLQAESEMSNSWELYLALAETYDTLSEFDSALGNIDQAQRVISGSDNEQQKIIYERLEEKRTELETRQLSYQCMEDAKKRAIAGNPAEALRVLKNALDNPKIKDGSAIQSLRDQIFAQASQELLQKVQAEQDKGSDEGKIQAVTALVDLQILEELIDQPTEKWRSTAGLNRLRADLASVANAVIAAAIAFDPTTMSLRQAIDQASSLSARLQSFDNVIPLFNAELEPVRDKLTRRRRDTATALENLLLLEEILQRAGHQSLWETAIQTGDFQTLEHYYTQMSRLEFDGMQEVRVYARRLAETKEISGHLLDVIGQVRQKFSMEEDFDFVKRIILETEIQPPFRENNQAWQGVHAKEYQAIRILLDDHLRVPDVYGRSDLVGWQKVLEQADERAKELEMWRDWDRYCADKMDMAAKAIQITEQHPADLPTRIKKADWEKVRDVAQAAVAALTYQQEDKFLDQENVEQRKYTTAVGVSNSHNEPVPARSRAARDIEEEGKRRKKIAEEYLHLVEIQVQALEETLKRRGFPSVGEFNSAVFQSDWELLENLLIRAREAGITNESERKRVDTFARVLEQKRQEQQKKRFKLW